MTVAGWQAGWGEISPHSHPGAHFPTGDSSPDSPSSPLCSSDSPGLHRRPPVPSLVSQLSSLQRPMTPGAPVPSFQGLSFPASLPCRPVTQTQLPTRTRCSPLAAEGGSTHFSKTTISLASHRNGTQHAARSPEPWPCPARKRTRGERSWARHDWTGSLPH